MMHAFGKSIELKINVLTDEIVLFGHANEAAGKMLQGSVSLNLTESTKVKSVHLSFIGKMKVFWSEGSGHAQHYHKQERTILTHEWQFVRPQLSSAHSSVTNIHNTTSSKKSNHTLFNPGQYKWNFEFMLPGNLPQTLDSDVGTVSYRFKAIVEKSGFMQQTVVKKKDVRVLRCILPSQFELVQSLEIHNTWAQKMVYDISVPSKVCAFGDTIPISFQILPIASRLRVYAIIASVKEYCTFTANDHTKTDTRIVKLIRVDHPFSEAVTTTASPTWNRVVEFPVPATSPLIFADAENDMIRIHHRLKFVISLVNADGHISELRCAVQIVVVESFAVTEELTTLPVYDAMWRSVPYHPTVVETLRRGSISDNNLHHESRQPVTISGWSRTLSVSDNAESSTAAIDIPSSINSSRNHSRRPSVEQEWWHGVDLDKVPSYKSVVTLDISTSLPPMYDTLSNHPPTPRG